MTKRTVFTPEILEVDNINIAKLPTQEVSFLRLKIIERGAADQIRLPVIVAKGRHPGPVFGITAAVHGNEVNGIPLVHELIKGLRLNRMYGTVIAPVVVNVPGFHLSERYLGGADLNHLMPGKKEGNFGQVYAYRIMNKLIKKMDYLVDLHTASFGRVNSLYIRADLNDKTAARMAHLQKPEIILHNPPSDYTLRGAAAELGIPSITVEIGDASVFQYKYIRRSLIGVRSILGYLGMIKYERPEQGFSAPIICEKSDWIYTDRGGILRVLPGVTDRVKKGQTIAQLDSIFGLRKRDYTSHIEGVVIGKAVNPVAETGSRIIHLGVVAKKNSRLRANLT